MKYWFKSSKGLKIVCDVGNINKIEKIKCNFFSVYFKVISTSQWRFIQSCNNKYMYTKNINRLNGQLQIKCKYKIRRFKLSSTSTSVGFKLISDVLFFWLKSFFWSSLHDSSTIKLEKSILFITLCFQKVLSLSIFQIIRRASASELWESFYETNIVNPDVS